MTTAIPSAITVTDGSYLTNRILEATDNVTYGHRERRHGRDGERRSEQQLDSLTNWSS